MSEIRIQNTDQAQIVEVIKLMLNDAIAISQNKIPRGWQRTRIDLYTKAIAEYLKSSPKSDNTIDSLFKDPYHLVRSYRIIQKYSDIKEHEPSPVL